MAILALLGGSAKISHQVAALPREKDVALGIESDPGNHRGTSGVDPGLEGATTRTGSQALSGRAEREERSAPAWREWETGGLSKRE